jgi:undecaprenyl-diphosphatase
MIEYDTFSTWLSSYNSPIATNISLFIDMFTYPLLFLFLLYLAFVKNDKKRALAMAAAYLVLLLLIPSLKFVFSEVRPCSAPWKIQCPLDYSLPSGHAAAVAVLLAAYLTSSAFPFTLLVYVIVSLSRIYLGVHVFKDILAGTVLAFASFLLMNKILSSKMGEYYIKARSRDKVKKKWWSIEG